MQIFSFFVIYVSASEPSFSQLFCSTLTLVIVQQFNMQAVAIFYGTQLNIVLYSSQERRKLFICSWSFDEFMYAEWGIELWDGMKWAGSWFEMKEFVEFEGFEFAEELNEFMVC
jgi:hypothetical protein